MSTVGEEGFTESKDLLEVYEADVGRMTGLYSILN